MRHPVFREVIHFFLVLYFIQEYLFLLQQFLKIYNFKNVYWQQNYVHILAAILKTSTKLKKDVLLEHIASIISLCIVEINILYEWTLLIVYNAILSHATCHAFVYRNDTWDHCFSSSLNLRSVEFQSAPCNWWKCIWFNVCSTSPKVDHVILETANKTSHSHFYKKIRNWIQLKKEFFLHHLKKSQFFCISLLASHFEQSIFLIIQNWQKNL